MQTEFHYFFFKKIAKHNAKIYIFFFYVKIYKGINENEVSLQANEVIFHAERVTNRRSNDRPLIQVTDTYTYPTTSNTLCSFLFLVFMAETRKYEKRSPNGSKELQQRGGTKEIAEDRQSLKLTFTLAWVASPDVTNWFTSYM